MITHQQWKMAQTAAIAEAAKDYTEATHVAINAGDWSAVQRLAFEMEARLSVICSQPPPPLDPPSFHALGVHSE